MIVCGLDPCTPFRPGPRSKKPAKLPVWFAFDYNRTAGSWYVGKAPPKCAFPQFDLLVCERPHPHGKVSAQGAITMGVWAGWLAAQADADRTLCMPPQVWKKILIPGFETAPKAQFCANINQMLEDSNPDFDPTLDSDQDLLDARGLCEVARVLLSQDRVDEFKKWELKL